MDDASTRGHVRGAQRGDESAWDRLTQKIDEELRPRVRSRDVPPGWDVDDVLQIVHCEVFRSIAKVGTSDTDDFRAWVRTIFRQRLVDLWRRKRARDKHLPEVALSGDETLGDERVPSPSVVVRAAEATARLEAVTAHLSERHRAVLRLREEDDADYAEIAERVGLESAAAARYLFAYARRRRAEMMRSYYDSVIVA